MFHSAPRSQCQNYPQPLPSKWAKSVPLQVILSRIPPLTLLTSRIPSPYLFSSRISPDLWCTKRTLLPLRWSDCLISILTTLKDTSCNVWADSSYCWDFGFVFYITGCYIEGYMDICVQKQGYSNFVEATALIGPYQDHTFIVKVWASKSASHNKWLILISSFLSSSFHTFLIFKHWSAISLFFYFPPDRSVCLPNFAQTTETIVIKCSLKVCILKKINRKTSSG